MALALSFGAEAKRLTHRTDSLLRQLDVAVRDEAEASADRRRRIARSITNLHNAATDSDRYNVYRTLYSLYRSYSGDSARWVAERRLEAAEATGNHARIRSASMNLAESYSLAGDYSEALHILDTIPRTDIPDFQKKYLFTLYRTIYERLSKTDAIKSNIIIYDRLQRAYTDSALQVTSKSDRDYNYLMASRLILAGNADEALKYLDLPDSLSASGRSRVLNKRAAAFHMLNQRDDEIEALAEAALADLNDGLRDYSALPSLAQLLDERGESSRAYSYIRRALEDARLCNAKSRTTEVLELIPLIDASYAEADRQRIAWLYALLGVAVALAVALSFSLRSLSKRNRTIHEVNESLKLSNRQLNDSNLQLEATNHRLAEANRERVRYITEVFDAHSGYISRMASLRGNLLKFLTSSQPAKARRLLEAEAAEEQELKELYTRFDTIFLRLYPDFIEAYNSLVREECRVNPKSASLTSELRVLALMKIGVRRSSRIAELLHYSPQTVYNYKSTLRAAMTDPAALDLWLDNPMP